MKRSYVVIAKFQNEFYRYHTKNFWKLLEYLEEIPKNSGNFRFANIYDERTREHLFIIKKKDFYK